ncbi:flagellar biosynthesis regulator FlaF [Sphingorhabdus sp. EL138]|jgi:flagellar protein FlaF|uniref:flagellar biosynthesis regulator FlaF n=1 Tax=Sphingorhabdus sp. EL138 TaxID=2073156 RepID=UPI0025FAD0B8|nr:flagellar biosynthesis regulator FlaF [Sphingorhabdus sp. EL138]
MLDAYRRNQLNAEHPRSMERRLLAEITSEMISAADQGLLGSALMPSLHRNRELWSVWSATCLDNDNALPPEIRATIVSLALWVGRFTSEVVAGREEIEPLVSVNRSVIAALA